MDLSLEELGRLQVTTLSRKAQKLSDTPAAVSIVTAEDIRRSGARSIPEALRMVPGVDVAQIGAGRWAVGVRGFKGRFSNKLLVQVDGRNVYTSFFSGVFWENENLMLEDVERIEVVRGPGAALWGTNAVNGVINVITKRAAATPGTLLTATLDDQGHGEVAARQGFVFAEGGAGRAYVRSVDRPSSDLRNGDSAQDDQSGWHAGFRLDQNRGALGWTLEGSAFHQNSPEFLSLQGLGVQPFVYGFEGGSVLARGTWALAEGEARVQVYGDHLKATLANLASGTLDAMDVDFQHRLDPRGQHELIWGAGLRVHRFSLDTYGASLTLMPNRGDEHVASLFLQDEITLDPAWRLTLGARLEYNSLSGTEFQPNARVLWTPTRTDSLWASVARAARVPSIGESYGQLLFDLQPLPPGAPAPAGCGQQPCALAMYSTFEPGTEFRAEHLLALELGYRHQFDRGSLEAVVFHHRYSQLLGSFSGPVLTPSALLPFPVLGDALIYRRSAMGAQNLGLELGAEVPVRDWARLQVSYTLQNLTVDKESDPIAVATGALWARVSPHYVLASRLSMDLAPGHDLDVSLRHVGAGASAAKPIPAYTAVDAHYRWTMSKNFSLSGGVQNLSDQRHLEFHSDYFSTQATYVRRSAFLKGVWRF